MLFSLMTCLVMVFYVVSVSGGVMAWWRPPRTEGFSYQDTHSWGENYPDCNGQRQSPIDLDPNVFHFITNGGPLRWKGYDNVPEKMIIINNGHTFQLSGVWSESSTPSISGGPLPSEYIFEQLHFHWGPDDSVGSEHLADGKSFPLELHMVHWKRDYGSFQNALGHPDGLSVIGVFFGVNNADHRTSLLNVLFDYTKNVREIESQVRIPPFPLSVFDAINDTHSFFTYLGSLTTPPCSQIVIWIIPNILTNVSSSQIMGLRSLKLNDDVRANFRPIQSRNNRIIYQYIPARSETHRRNN